MPEAPPTLTKIAAPRTFIATLWSDYLLLAKVRLNGMVAISTAVGFIVGSRAVVDWSRLLWTVFGTFLAAMGASAFNQAIESHRDALMKRTRNRPVPAGRMSRMHAALFGMWTSVAGIAIICPTSNGLTAVLVTANVLIYALLYTPLKPISTVNTLVGAVVGAIPPVIGWTAACGRVDTSALVLGALLFVWQIPHFLALAWMYRADYAAAGYRMMPASDPTGRRTAFSCITYSVALIPIGVVMRMTGATGTLFVLSATVLGAWMFYRSVVFFRERTETSARKLFICSVLYLPAVLTMMVVDARFPRQEFLELGNVRVDKNSHMTPEQGQELMKGTALQHTIEHGRPAPASAPATTPATRP